MRDYYRVEDEHGGAYWIYRAGLYSTGGTPHGTLHGTLAPAGETTDDAAVVAPPVWYLHGLF